MLMSDTGLIDYLMSDFILLFFSTEKWWEIQSLALIVLNSVMTLFSSSDGLSSFLCLLAQEWHRPGLDSCAIILGHGVGSCLIVYSRHTQETVSLLQVIYLIGRVLLYCLMFHLLIRYSLPTWHVILTVF